ncbi:MAG: hypothetical protein R6U61_06815 [Thermoplasmata archaeon]
MSDKVLSTKVPDDEVETIKNIAEEEDESISSLLRKLLHKEVQKKKVDWRSPCFGSNPREDEPKIKDTTIDEVLYGK